MASNKLISAIKFPPFFFFLLIVVGFISVQGYSIYIDEETELVDIEIDIFMKYEDRQHEFVPNNITLKPGMKVRFNFINDGYVTHNFATQKQQEIGNDPGILIRPRVPISTIWTVPMNINEITDITHVCTYHDGMNLRITVDP